MQTPLRISRPRLLIPGNLSQAAGLRIDWRHPLTNSLQACCLPTGAGGVVDIVESQHINVTGITSVRARGPAASKFLFAANVSTAANVTTNFTLAAVGYKNANNTGAQSELFARCAYASEGSNQGWQIAASDSDASINSAFFNNNSGSNYALNFAVSGIGQYTLGCTTDGTTRRNWVNGEITASATSATKSVVCASCSGTMGQGSRALATNQDFDLNIGCVWSREFNTHEMQWFHADPFCFLTTEEFELPEMSAAATRGLFIPPSLNGLGAGGSFFQNRV